MAGPPSASGFGGRALARPHDRGIVPGISCFPLVLPVGILAAFAAGGGDGWRSAAGQDRNRGVPPPAVVIIGAWCLTWAGCGGDLLGGSYAGGSVRRGSRRPAQILWWGREGFGDPHHLHIAGMRWTTCPSTRAGSLAWGRTGGRRAAHRAAHCEPGHLSRLIGFGRRSARPDRLMPPAIPRHEWESSTASARCPPIARGVRARRRNAVRVFSSRLHPLLPTFAVNTSRDGPSSSAEVR